MPSGASAQALQEMGAWKPQDGTPGGEEATVVAEHSVHCLENSCPHGQAPLVLAFNSRERQMSPTGKQRSRQQATVFWQGLRDLRAF